MDCTQIEELMMDFLYQELDSTQTSAYRAHLTGCAKCAAQLAGYERTRHAVRRLPDMDPPAAVTARLLHEAAARRPVQAVEAVAAGVGAGRTVVVANEGAAKGIWAWLTGWMQPLMAHPGFAAVAGLVIIGGIAGFLVVSGKVNSEAPSARSSAEAFQETSQDQSPGLATAKDEESNLAGAPAPVAAAPTAPAAEPMLGGAPDPGLADGRYRRENDQGVLDRGGDTAGQQPRAGRMASPAEEQKLGGYAIGGEGGAMQGTGSGGGGGRAAGVRVGGDNLAEREDAPRTKDLEAPRGAETSRAQDRKADKNAPAKSVTRPADPAPRPTEKAPTVSQDALSGTKSPSAPKPDAAKKEQKPAAQAPPPPVSRGPAGKGSAGAGAAPSESFDDADEGSAAGAAPSPPRDAPMAQAESAPAEAKKKAKPDAKETEARKLHGQARAKANTGDCSSALKLRARIYRVDPTYFDRSVKNDADLSRCSNQSKKPARKSRDDAELVSPAANDAPATAPSTK